MLLVFLEIPGISEIAGRCAFVAFVVLPCFAKLRLLYYPSRPANYSLHHQLTPPLSPSNPATNGILRILRRIQRRSLLPSQPQLGTRYLSKMLLCALPNPRNQRRDNLPQLRSRHPRHSGSCRLRRRHQIDSSLIPWNQLPPKLDRQPRL